MKKLLLFLKLAGAILLIAFVTIASVLRFQHPELTETQLFVRTCQAFIPR